MSAKTIGIWVQVDAQRVLGRFSSEDLLSEVASRKSVPLPEERQERDDVLLDAINEAMGCLRSGRTEDALLTLERLAYPKFKSFDHGVAKYLQHAR